jgi:hypothetical protein
MIQRARCAAATVVVAAALLAADPSGWWTYAPVKWAIISSGGLLLVALSLLDPLRRPAPRPLRWGVAGGLAWLALCAAFGSDPRYAWMGTPERNAGWLLWALAAALLVSAVPWHAVIHGMVVAGCAMAPWLLFDAADRPWIDAGTSRLTGPFGSAAYLGAACTMIAPAAAGLALDRASTRTWRVAGGVAAATAVFGVTGSATRGAWIGLGVVALWLAARHRRARLTWQLAAAVAAVVVLAALTTPVVQRASDTFDRQAAGGAGRIDEWRVGIRTLARHPLLGSGPEGYRIDFADGVDRTYERAHGRQPQADRAHSGPLDIALLAGVPGLMMWLGLAVFVVRHLRSVMRGPAKTGAVMALVGYQVQQLFLFPLAELEPIAWVLAGGLLATTWPAAVERDTSLLHRAGAALAGAASAGALVLGGLDVAADRLAQRAIDSGEVAYARRAVELRPDRLRLHLLEAALTQGAAARVGAVDRGLQWSPDDPIALIRRVEYLAVSDPSAAIGQLRQLTANDPLNASLQLLLGTAAANTGDLATAEKAWLAALDLAPNDPRPAANLATLYERQGRAAEADAMSELAEEVGNP